MLRNGENRPPLRLVFQNGFSVGMKQARMEKPRRECSEGQGQKKKKKKKKYGKMSRSRKHKEMRRFAASAKFDVEMVLFDIRGSCKCHWRVWCFGFMHFAAVA